MLAEVDHIGRPFLIKSPRDLQVLRIRQAFSWLALRFFALRHLLLLLRGQWPIRCTALCRLECPAGLDADLVLGSTRRMVVEKMMLIKGRRFGGGRSVLEWPRDEGLTFCHVFRARTCRVVFERLVGAVLDDD